MARGGRWRKSSLPAGLHAPALAAPVEAGRRHPAGAIAWLPTLRTKVNGPLEAHHLRWRHPQAKPGTLHVLLLDTSGSMRQSGRLPLAKGYAAQVLEQAARVGDHVALLCFGGQGVDVVLPPGPARRAATARVYQRAGGGGTPLAQALATADALMAQHRRVRGQNGSAGAVLWLLTDGRTVEQPRAPRDVEQVVIVDFDDAKRAVGRCADWAALWGADYRRAV